jgi:hypothetical protein
MPGSAIAQLGDRRSRPAPVDDHLRLVVEPTRHVDGRVELGNVPRTKTFIVIEPVDSKTNTYRFVAPIGADGTFALDGVTMRKAQIGVAVQNSRRSARFDYQILEASPDAVHGIVVRTLQSDRTLDVLARSTIASPLEGAQILLFPGQILPKDVGELMKRLQLGDMQFEFGKPPTGEQVPEAVRDKARPGDLLAHFTNVRDGDLTVCAIGINGDISDPAFARAIQAHVRELQLKCELVAPGDHAIVLDAPPQKRFD